jgi:hypothetical protein
MPNLFVGLQGDWWCYQVKVQWQALLPFPLHWGLD